MARWVLRNYVLRHGSGGEPLHNGVWPVDQGLWHGAGLVETTALLSCTWTLDHEHSPRGLRHHAGAPMPSLTTLLHGHTYGQPKTLPPGPRVRPHLGPDRPLMARYQPGFADGREAKQALACYRLTSYLDECQFSQSQRFCAAILQWGMIARHDSTRGTRYRQWRGFECHGRGSIIRRRGETVPRRPG